MTNIALGFVLWYIYLPLDSHLELYNLFHTSGSALSNTYSMYHVELVCSAYIYYDISESFRIPLHPHMGPPNI